MSNTIEVKAVLYSLLIEVHYPIQRSNDDYVLACARGLDILHLFVFACNFAWDMYML